MFPNAKVIDDGLSWLPDPEIDWRSSRTSQRSTPIGYGVRFGFSQVDLAAIGAARRVLVTWAAVVSILPPNAVGAQPLILIEVPQSVLPLDGCKAGEVNMEFAHWLMIGGGLLVFVGGTALQRRRAAADPSEGKVADEQPAVPMPKSPE